MPRNKTHEINVKNSKINFNFPPLDIFRESSNPFFDPYSTLFEFSHSSNSLIARFLYFFFFLIYLKKLIKPLFAPEMNQVIGAVPQRIKSIEFSNFETRVYGQAADAVALVLPKTLDLRVVESMYLVKKHDSLSRSLELFMNKLTEVSPKKGKVAYWIFFNIPDQRQLLDFTNKYFQKKYISCLIEK